MSTITITGGTGLIGTALTHLLIDHGHRVIILARNAAPGSRASSADGKEGVGESDGREGMGKPHGREGTDEPSSAAAFYGRPSGPGLRRLHWDPVAGYIDPEAIRQADF